MNSNRYRDKIFDEAIARGLSPRRANKLADSQAKRYQADRGQYLDGLLNSYGREGFVMTSQGNQILGELAHEDPLLANLYATIYPNAKEAVQHGYALDLLDAGHKNNLESIKAQTAGNIEYANAQHANTLQRDKIQHGYGKENAYDQYRFSTWLARNQGAINAEQAKLQGAITRQNQRQLADLNYGNWVMQEDYKMLFNDKAFQQKVAQFSAFADYLGYEGDRKKAFIEAAFGIKVDTKTGETDKASVENYKKLHDMLDSDEKNVLKQIEDAGLDLDAQTREKYQAQLEDIRAFKQELEDKVGEQLGLKNQDAPAYTGDLGKDIPLISQLLQTMKSNGANEKEMFDRISKWARETDPKLTDFEIQNLILTAQSNSLGGK